MQDKLDTALANGKIMADSIAADIRTKISWLDANAAEHRALLADLQQLIAKPLDDFKLTINTRIEAHQKAEAERLDAERTRIRAEEEAKARAEAEAKVRAEQQAAAPVAEKEPYEAIKQAATASPLNPPMARMRRPSSDSIIETVARSFNVEIDIAEAWIIDIGNQAAQRAAA